MENKTETHNKIAREMDRLEALKIKVIIGFGIFWLCWFGALAFTIWYYWIR